MISPVGLRARQTHYPNLQLQHGAVVVVVLAVGVALAPVHAPALVVPVRVQEEAADGWFL